MQTSLDFLHIFDVQSWPQREFEIYKIATTQPEYLRCTLMSWGHASCTLMSWSHARDL